MLGIGLKTTALRRILSKNFGIGRFYEDSFRKGNKLTYKNYQYRGLNRRSLGKRKFKYLQKNQYRELNRRSLGKRKYTHLEKLST